MPCYCVLPSRYDASVLQFVTAGETLIILITLYDSLRHCFISDRFTAYKIVQAITFFLR